MKLLAEHDIIIIVIIIYIITFEGINVQAFAYTARMVPDVMFASFHGNDP